MKGGGGGGGAERERARERERERGSLWVLRENKVHVRTSPSAMLREKGLVLAQLTSESYASKGIAPGVVPLPVGETTLARFPTTISFETSFRNNVFFPKCKRRLLSQKRKKTGTFPCSFPVLEIQSCTKCHLSAPPGKAPRKRDWSLKEPRKYPQTLQQGHNTRVARRRQNSVSLKRGVRGASRGRDGTGDARRPLFELFLRSRRDRNPFC